MKRTSLFFLACLATAACGLAESGLGTDGGGPGDVGVPFDATDEQNVQDATVSDGDAGGDGGAEADASACPTTLAGPAMVPVDEYCVDSTEVTRDQYVQFVTAFDGGVANKSCTWKQSFAPGDPSSQTNPSNPIVEVDWCDAYEYCAWAKKRLCGARDGGAIDWNDNATDPNTARWYNACSKGAANTYAYGSTWNSTTCNDDDNNNGVVAVKSYTQCVGGFPGLYDMTGNAKEWIDQCNPTGNADNDDCHVIGGGYHDDDQSAECFDMETHQRNNGGDDDIGFRCCWP